jgi:hypothetical protein
LHEVFKLIQQDIPFFAERLDFFPLTGDAYRCGRHATVTDVTQFLPAESLS